MPAIDTKYKLIMSKLYDNENTPATPEGKRTSPPSFAGFNGSTLSAVRKEPRPDVPADDIKRLMRRMRSFLAFVATLRDWGYDLDAISGDMRMINRETGKVRRFSTLGLEEAFRQAMARWDKAFYFEPFRPKQYRLLAYRLAWIKATGRDIPTRNFMKFALIMDKMWHRSATEVVRMIHKH